MVLKKQILRDSEVANAIRSHVLVAIRSEEVKWTVRKEDMKEGTMQVTTLLYFLMSSMFDLRAS